MSPKCSFSSAKPPQIVPVLETGDKPSFFSFAEIRNQKVAVCSAVERARGEPSAAQDDHVAVSSAEIGTSAYRKDATRSHPAP